MILLPGGSASSTSRRFPTLIRNLSGCRISPRLESGSSGIGIGRRPDTRRFRGLFDPAPLALPLRFYPLN